MIKSFLYELDRTNRKTICGVVENDEIVENKESDTFKTNLFSTYKLKEDERISENTGKLYYCYLINPTKEISYIDVSISKAGVTVKLTNKIAFATPLSKKVILAILDHFNYFELEDFKLIESGYIINRHGEKRDLLEKHFKNIKDDSYCQIIEDGISFYVAKDEDGYYLEEDFIKACKVNHKDIRNILLLNEFITVDTPKEMLSFAEFKCFKGINSYVLYTYKPIRISFSDNILEVMTDTTLQITDRLLNSKDVYQLGTEIIDLLYKPATGQTFTLEFNGRFVVKKDNSYVLVDNPALASLIDESEITLFKKAMALFRNEVTINTYFNQLMYLYQLDEENYKVTSSKVNEFISAKIILKHTFDKFIATFLNFNPLKTTGNIAILNDKFIEIKFISKQDFVIKFHDDAYHATLLTLEEVNSLQDVLKEKFVLREIRNIPNPLVYDDSKKSDVCQYYSDLLDTIASRQCDLTTVIDDKELKVFSEKGSFEYLLRNFPKTYLDAKMLFTKIFAAKKVKNLLIVGDSCHIELLALNDICQEKVNVSLISNSKWGHKLTFKKNNNVSINGNYRFDFAYANKLFLKQFDAIFFTRSFIGTKDNFRIIQALKNDLQDMLYANIRVFNDGPINDPFYACYKKDNISRKYFKHDQDVLEKLFGLSDAFLQNNVYNKTDKKPIIPAFDNKASYYTLVKIENKKIIDLNQK